tara:strand:- start:1235 stop:1492 length:258 start_codon:yes stop_codon:yes gene_type:complete
MENLKVRCRSCGKEIEGHPSKTVSCGCSNMTTIRGDRVSAVDLSNIVMLNSVRTDSKSSFLSNQDLAFQEARRKRKVRKLNFEVR